MEGGHLPGEQNARTGFIVGNRTQNYLSRSVRRPPSIEESGKETWQTKTDNSNDADVVSASHAEGMHGRISATTRRHGRCTRWLNRSKVI